LNNTKSYNKLDLFIIYVAIISYTKILGLYQHEGGLGIGNLNVLGMVQLVSVLLLIAGLVINVTKLKFPESQIKKFIVLYFAIIIFSIVKGFFNVSRGEIGLGDYLHNIRTLYIYVFFIFLLSAFKSKKDLYVLFKITNNLAIIAAIIALYQVLFVKGEVEHGNMLYDQFRYMTTTGFLMAFSFYYYFSLILLSKKASLKRILLSLLLLVATAIQMHRSVLIGLGFTMLIGLLFVPGNFFSKIKKTIITVFIVTIISFAILKITNFSVGFLGEMIAGTTNNLNEGTGSFFVRTYVLLNTIVDVFHHYPLFGRGFVWKKLDIMTYLTTFKAYGPTYDNTYSSVLVCFGFVGFASYLFLIIFSLKGLLIKVRKRNDIYSYSLLLILVYYIISSYFGDYLFGFSSTIITLIMFFCIALDLSQHKINKNNVSRQPTSYIDSHANL